jgi:DnaJ-class molecular chaperone
LAAIRRSYKQLAVALHPDKCSLEHAAEAFQRLHKAYTNLSKAGPCS